MTYGPRLEPAFSARMNGLPDEALDVAISVVADICTDPYNRMTSIPRVPAATRSGMSESRNSVITDSSSSVLTTRRAWSTWLPSSGQAEQITRVQGIDGQRPAR